MEYEILYHIVKFLYICNTSLPLKFDYKTGTSSLHARPSLGGIRDATGEGSGGAGGRRQGSAEHGSMATWHRDGQNTGTCGIKTVWIIDSVDPLTSQEVEWARGVAIQLNEVR